MIQAEPVNTDVLVIGAGPAGLAAATRLRKLGVEKVLVIDRESQAGGIPRHCFHTGFGWFDLRRVLSGPDYALAHHRQAEQAGVEIQLETTAQHWNGESTIQTTSPSGIQNITARAILLATGCRERPRSARLIPGSRPRGIYNTGSLQQLVYLKNLKPGKNAIIVGAEHVSYSALPTLRHLGTKVVAMITEHHQHQTYLPFYWGAKLFYHIPLMTNYKVTHISGRNRVEAIEITSTRTGEKQQLECDTLVFTGDWIPDHELARKGNITLNRHTRGPEIDQSLRTSNPGIFAAGNLLHGVEKADIAALEGRHAADCIISYLSSNHWPLNNRIPIGVNSPLLWISPNAITPGNNSTLPLNRFTFRSSAFLRNPELQIILNGKQLHSQSFRKIVPNRWYHLDGHWVSQLDPDPDLVGSRIDIQIIPGD